MDDSQNQDQEGSLGEEVAVGKTGSAQPETTTTTQSNSEVIREVKIGSTHTFEASNKRQLETTGNEKAKFVNEGTPNRCLARLVEECINIHYELGGITVSPALFVVKGKKALRMSESYIPVEDARDLVDRLNEISRSDLTSLDKKLISDILEKAISAIKSPKRDNKRDVTDSYYISRLWYTLLVKSISDVAQFGSTIRNAHTLIDNTMTNNRMYPTVCYLSSDLIAAALSTTLGRQVNHPYLILSSRKASNITQTIILQKRELTTISIFLLCLLDETQNILTEIMQNYTGEGLTEQDQAKRANVILGVYKSLNEVSSTGADGHVNTFKSAVISIFKQPKNEIKYPPKNGFMKNIQLWADEYIETVPTAGIDKDIYDKYVTFFESMTTYQYNYDPGTGSSEPHSIANIYGYLEHMIEHGSSSTFFHIPRWIYQLTTDISHLNKSIDQELDTTAINNLSLAEIIAATEDAAYGHDYAGIPGLTSLGEVFMEKVIVNSNENIDNYRPFYYQRNNVELHHGSYEKICIIDALNRNKYVTITQENDHYVTIFNNAKNFLVVNTSELPLQNTITKWNIGQSPYFTNYIDNNTNLLIPRSIYISVDFSRGTPNFYEHVASIKNTLRSYNTVPENTNAFDFMTSRDYGMLLRDIEGNTGLKELIDVTTLFDGAAPIGVVPEFLYDNSNTGSENGRTLIPHMNTINVDGLKLSITTETSGSYDVHDWFNKHAPDSNALVQKISDRLMTVIQTPNMGVDQNIKTIIEARDDNAYMYNFELILGMFFNAKFRTSEYAKNYQEIINGISPALEKIQSDRPGRQRNKSQVALEAEQNDPNLMITTMKNNTIQMIAPRLVEKNEEEQIQKINGADEIIARMTDRYGIPISSSSSAFSTYDVVAQFLNLFNDILRYEKQQEEEEEEEEDGEVDENKETTFDCVMNAMTGALNMSANNATTGVFSTGESISSSGVVNSETITALLQEQIRVRKVYELLNADVRRNVGPETPPQKKSSQNRVPRSADPRLETEVQQQNKSDDGENQGSSDAAIYYNVDSGSDTEVAPVSEGAYGPAASTNLFLRPQPAVALPVTGQVNRDPPPGSFGTPVASSADLAALGIPPPAPAPAPAPAPEGEEVSIVDPGVLLPPPPPVGQGQVEGKSNKRTRSEASLASSEASLASDSEHEAEATASEAPEPEAEASEAPDPASTSASASASASTSTSAPRRNPPRKVRQNGGSRSGTRRKKKVHRKPHSSRKRSSNKKNKQTGSRKSKREKERKNKKTHRRR
jgi:hypothetical protein